MWEHIIPALGSIAASVIGGSMNSSAIKSSNQSNMELSSDMRKWNEKMYDKQVVFAREQRDAQFRTSQALMDQANQFSLDMWNRENAYNSPSSQMKRWRDAGLNPYLMMNGSSAGNASSLISASGSAALGSSPLAPSMNAPTVQPETMDLGTPAGILATLSGQLLQKRKQDADIANIEQQTNGKEIENKFMQARILAEIDKIRADTKNSETKRELDKLDLSIRGDSQVGDLVRRREEIENLKVQRQLSYMQNLLADKELQSYDQRVQAEIATKTADTYLKYAQGELTKKQARHEVFKALETISRSYGIDIDNDLKNKTFDSLVKEADARAQKAWNNRFYESPYQYYQSVGGKNWYWLHQLKSASELFGR